MDCACPKITERCQVTLREECVMDVSGQSDQLSEDSGEEFLTSSEGGGQCPGGVCAFPDLVGQFIQELVREQCGRKKVFVTFDVLSFKSRVGKSFLLHLLIRRPSSPFPRQIS